MKPQASNHKTPARVKWQWKSNSDPWSKTEEPQWTFYSPEHNYLIEKAYCDQEKEVVLDQHIVSIHHMIQKRKGMMISQRPIRRIICEGDEMDFRSERYFETELPKTINKVFGSLGHFISFFSRRNPEILDLTRNFEEFEQANDLHGLNTSIRLQLICCLEKELLKPIEGKLKDYSISLLQKKIILKAKERHEGLISLFQKEFASFEEFYGSILKSYTMNTDLYLNLNKYLRNESWSFFDNLLLYAICLCKAFFGLKKEDIRLQKAEVPMTLYRGTALDELALSSYQVGKAPKTFSWNAVTSTSTNQKMAENFMYLSADVENKKYPVLFIIEVPLVNQSGESEHLQWIDIHKYSAQPKEDEVILAPGSAFELYHVSIDHENRTTIKIRLRDEVESLAHEGLIMQGAFQAQMNNGSQIKIVYLEGEELFEALKNLTGNKLIEEIEFCLCTFENKSLKEMLDTLPTLEKVRRLKFESCKYEDEQAISSIAHKNRKNCNILRIEISEVQDFYKILNIQNEDSDYWKSLREIDIDFREKELLFTQKKYLGLQGLQYLTQLVSLKLRFSEFSEITDEGIKDLASQGLKYLTQLTSLTLDFSGCSQITNEGIRNLSSQGLKYLIQLTSMTLGFAGCSEITDEGIEYLASQGFKSLNKLTSLTLRFSGCSKTDEGILHYFDCFGITDEGIKNLAAQGLKHLAQLTSLALNFSYCSRITDEGIRDLASQGLQNLTKLTSLTLGFSGCPVITDEGIKDLASQGFKYLTQLTFFTLCFADCFRITDEGIKGLVSQEPEYLTQLTSLTLNFSYCSRITDEGIRDLASQGLQNLTKLTSLTLDFSGCSKITYDGIKNLASQGLKQLIQLNFVTLNFPFWIKEEIDALKYEILQYLPDLTSLILDSKMLKKRHNHQKMIKEQEQKNIPYDLSMNLIRKKTQNKLEPFFDDQRCSTTPTENSHFKTSLALSKWPKQSEEKAEDSIIAMMGLTSRRNNERVCSADLTLASSKTLPQARDFNSLARNFSGCSEIASEGIKDLTPQTLKRLTQLTFLRLNFSYESKITDERIKDLASQGLKYLTQLTSLALDFSRCSGITDDGIKNLAAQGLKYLTKLTSLTLNFSYCFEITNEGIKNLVSQGLKYLTQLTSLTLNFQACFEITDLGIKTLISQRFRYLSQLTSLTLHLPGCSKITDMGIKILASQGLKYLAKLTYLTLDFSGCCRITDNGVKYLIQNGIKYLIQLTFLTLEFANCSISKFSVPSITQILRYFGFLLNEVPIGYESDVREG